MHPIVSVSITGSIPLLVDYQSSRVSYTQQSVFLSLGRYLYWWTISPRGYHPPSSQCFYHWVDISASGLLDLEGIIHQIVSVSINGLILCWWIILPRGYHTPSSQCFYHWVDTSAIIRPRGYLHKQWWGLVLFLRGYHTPSNQCFYHWVDTSTGGLLVLECIIHPVISVSITGSIPLLVDYQSSRVSYTQQSVFLSLGRYLYWWTISPRGYHTPSSQCFYHWVDTSIGGLLVLEGIIHQIVSVSITGSIPLLVDYYSSRVSSTQQSVFLSLGRYLYWWTISPRRYHAPNSQCFYHQVDTSTGGLLVLEGIIHPVVSVSITGSIPLLVDHQSSRVSYTKQSVFLSLGYHGHPVVSVSITGSIPLLVDYQSSRVSSTKQSVFLSLGRYLCQWTISPRGYHPPSSQCFYHWVDTSASGLLDLEGIIHQIVSVSITRLIPLLVDYSSSRVSSTQQSVFLSLGRYLC